MFKRSRLVYGLLIAGYLVVLGWQVAEHLRVRQSARTALINRSRDISSTLGLVIRSQRRFGGMVAQERLESALNELVRGGELSGVALLNAAGEIVASAGVPVDTKSLAVNGEYWGSHSVILVNPVDLGSSLSPQGETNRPTIVVPRREFTNGPGFSPRDRLMEDAPPPPPPELRFPNGRDGEMSANAPTNGFSRPEMGPNRRRPDGPPRFFPGFRPDDPQYIALLERRGLHGLVIALSIEGYRRACLHDLWMRTVVLAFATVSAFGLGLAWRTVRKSSELQLRLIRASEMNSHLRQMNVAVAGLAHETRNPLNIIRGLAQLISKQENVSTEVRSRTREIIDETDRITGQINEFINYSRPREVQLRSVSIGSVVAEVARALTYDLEERRIPLEVRTEGLVIEADEAMLRQVVFNLLLNAIQAVPPGTAVQVIAMRDGADEVVLEVRDFGPGVKPEHRAEVFKPYFTTHERGTGLGLAVVQQIVLAHGWEIVCLPHAPTGAIFRIQHIRIVPTMHHSAHAS